jgi:hypothetical protein
MERVSETTKLHANFGGLPTIFVVRASKIGESAF